MKLFLKNSNVCDHNSPTSQTDGRTDGQTDRQTTCDRNTALCTKVHRAVKIEENALRVECNGDGARSKWYVCLQCCVYNKFVAFLCICSRQSLFFYQMCMATMLAHNTPSVAGCMPRTWGVPRRQSHRCSGLASLPSVGAIP